MRRKPQRKWRAEFSKWIKKRNAKRSKRTRKRKAEFSKQILKAVAVGTILIVIFSCIMVWKTQDLSPLGYLIPAVFAELAVGTGFYYHKAKAENEIKLRGQPPEHEEEEPES